MACGLCGVETEAVAHRIKNAQRKPEDVFLEADRGVRGIEAFQRLGDFVLAHENGDPGRAWSQSPVVASA